MALDYEGRPSFQALQHCSHPGTFAIVFYAFDILELEGKDLSSRPLTERRRHLAEVVRGTPILLSAPLPGTPLEIARMVRGFGLDGAVAKRLNSRYETGQRSGAWTKVKFAHRQEFVIGGFRPDGHRVDALVVGYYDDAGKLLAAGKVRAGMNAHVRKALFETLAPFATTPLPIGESADRQEGTLG